jgi:hypothetical protein
VTSRGRPRTARRASRRWRAISARRGAAWSADTARVRERRLGPCWRMRGTGARWLDSVPVVKFPGACARNWSARRGSRVTAPPFSAASANTGASLRRGDTSAGGPSLRRP